MGNAIYLTGFPGPSGTLDYPVLGQFPVDAGADPFDLRASRGLAYLLRAAPANPDVDVVLAGGPPFPAGMIDYPAPFRVSWPGARATIYPAASLGRSSAPDDTPANTYVGGFLNGPVNYSTVLFDGIEPTPSSKGGAGAIVMLDPRGELDDLIDLAWDGAALDILRGPPLARYDSYDVVGRLTTAGLLYAQRTKEIRLRDLGWQLEQADLHDQRYGGTGGMDGDAGIAGTSKPYGAGPNFNIEPPLINADLAIHQLSCSSILAVDEARDGAVALAFDADYPTPQALGDAAVPAAHYATCLARGLIRRGSPIVYAFTVDFRGDNDTINGQGYPHTRGEIARRVATGRGTIRLADNQIDYASLSRLEQEQADTVGFYWAGAITKAAALSEIMAGCLGWWAMRLNGLLALGFMDEPMAAPALIINYPEDFGSTEPQMMQTYQAPRRATYVGWKRNYTIQDASRLAGLSIDRGDALIYGQPTRYASSVDGFQASMWPTAATVYVGGGFDSEASGSAEARRQQRVMGVRRERWRVTVPCDPFADLLGKVVQVNGFPRYGWGAARKFICVGIGFATSLSVTLDLWG
jgi:hypothetical protein